MRRRAAAKRLLTKDPGEPGLRAGLGRTLRFAHLLPGLVDT